MNALDRSSRLCSAPLPHLLQVRATRVSAAFLSRAMGGQIPHLCDACLQLCRLCMIVLQKSIDVACETDGDESLQTRQAGMPGLDLASRESSVVRRAMAAALGRGGVNIEASAETSAAAFCSCCDNELDLFLSFE